MDERSDHLRPVVVAIGGFLCGGGDAKRRRYSFWGIPIAALEAQGFRVVTVSPSPVGSLHDRACQIFYELKGGTVCYGEEHSRSHGHACHGETYRAGSFTAWGADNPIHLIGHSFGGQTARVLQHLLATGFFSMPGEYRTSAAWVRSVTACNSPLNGSLIVYSLGERAETAPAVRLGSHGHCLSVFIHVLELLDWGFFRQIFDPRLSHFELSWRHLGWRRAFIEVSRAIAGESAIFAQPDNAAFDMTVHSASRWNREIRIDPDTFYFSLVGRRPQRPSEQDMQAEAPTGGRAGFFSKILPRPVRGDTASKGVVTKLVYWLLRQLHVRRIGGHQRVVEALFGVPAESWDSVGHDGVLEAFTQSHPRVPAEYETPVSVGLPSCRSALQPGTWHTLPVHADHMWAHVNEEHARGVFEELARCLRLVADQLDHVHYSSEVRPPGVRRSARLLAKARRAGVVPTAAKCLEVEGRMDAADLVDASAVCEPHDGDGQIRCKVCTMEGLADTTGEGGRNIHGSTFVVDGSLLGEADSDDRSPGLWAAIILSALILIGIAVIFGDRSCVCAALANVHGFFGLIACPSAAQLTVPASAEGPEVESGSPGVWISDAHTVRGVDL